MARTFAQGVTVYVSPASSLVQDAEGKAIEGADPVRALLELGIAALPEGTIARIESDETAEKGTRRIALQIAPTGFEWPVAKVDEMLALARNFPTFTGKTHADAQAFLLSLLPQAPAKK